MRLISRMKRHIGLAMGVLACAFLVGLGIWFQAKGDRLKTKDWFDARLTYLPSGKFLKPLVMGFDEVVSDIIWIKGMMYFADAYLEHREYPWLAHIVDIVITMDPLFEYAYEFGGLILAEDPGSIESALDVLDRGTRQFPGNFRLKILAAMTCLSHDSNYQAASDFLKPLIHNQDAPAYMRSLAATLLDKGGDRSAALTWLVESYFESESPINREFILKKIAALYGHDGPYTEKLSGLEQVLKSVEARPDLLKTVLERIPVYLDGRMDTGQKQVPGIISE